MTSGTKDALPHEIQIGGDHYKSMKIQPIEFIMANNLGFCEGNAIKYICRFRSKNGIEDLKKAKHYIDMLIEMEGKKNADQTSKASSTRGELDRRSDDRDGVRKGLVPIESRYYPSDTVYGLLP